MPFGIDISSIARKITTGEGFSYLKADEWRVYSLYLSPLLLKGRIPGANYDNWMLFVSAMRIMSMPNIAISDARRCHEKVVLFCKGFEELYGKASLYGKKKKKKKKKDIHIFSFIYSHNLRKVTYIITSTCLNKCLILDHGIHIMLLDLKDSTWT